MLVSNDHVKVHPNGSLQVSEVQSTDQANYTCRAANVYGADEITVALVVKGKSPLTEAIAFIRQYALSYLRAS